MLGVHGLTAVTTVIAETPLQVHGVYDMSTAALKEQVRSLLACYPVAAIKTGLLGPASNVVAVAELLEQSRRPLVVDPVLSSSTGTSFDFEGVITAYRERLLPLATVLTPNQPEAEKLLSSPSGPGLQEEPLELASQLGSTFDAAVVLTGGHGTGKRAIDLLWDDNRVSTFESPRAPVASAHGTGCTFSSALTAFLAQGHSLHQAVSGAKHVVTRALTESYQWTEESSSGELRALNQLPAEAFRVPASK